MQINVFDWPSGHTYPVNTVDDFATFLKRIQWRIIIIIIIIKFKFIPRSFYKNIQLRLTINIKLEIKIEVQNYNSKIMQFNYKNYRTN